MAVYQIIQMDMLLWHDTVAQIVGARACNSSRNMKKRRRKHLRVRPTLQLSSHRPLLL